MMIRTVFVAMLALVLGCQTTREAYYNAWESMGYAKRERLVDNVKDASAAQTDAQKQFTSALEQFKSVVNFDGGNLEKMYNKLNDEYEECADRADTVNSRIASVKNVGTALFDEWKGEIKGMEDASLKSKSQDLYNKTEGSYKEMTARMDKAAASMAPVLKRFQDRVTFIKHNLNAQAISSLKGTEMELGAEIDALIKDMEASIKQADQFISEIKG